MTFKEAYKLMLEGHKVKMPEWQGYWFWNEQFKTIMIYTFDKQLLDIRDTKDVAFTFAFICREDWVIAK